MFVGSQGKNTGLPFPTPVDHSLSELSTVTRLSWVALHGMAHSFIELDKTVVHVTVKAVYCYPAYLTYMQSTS